MPKKKKKNIWDSKITLLFLSFMGKSRFFMDSLPMFHGKNHYFMAKSVLFMLKSPSVLVTSRFFTVKSLGLMDSIPIFMVKLCKIHFFSGEIPWDPYVRWWNPYSNPPIDAKIPTEDLSYHRPSSTAPPKCVCACLGVEMVRPWGENQKEDLQENLKDILPK